jgi:hypothetical protein
MQPLQPFIRLIHRGKGSKSARLFETGFWIRIRFGRLRHEKTL